MGHNGTKLGQEEIHLGQGTPLEEPGHCGGEYGAAVCGFCGHDIYGGIWEVADGAAIDAGEESVGVVDTQ